MNHKKVVIGSYFTIVLLILTGTSFSVGGYLNHIDSICIDQNTVTAMGPDLEYFPYDHDFEEVEEGVVYTTSFDIWNVGTGTLTWSLGIVDPWLSPSPVSGNSTGETDTVTVEVNTTGLSLGPYSGMVSISSNDGGGIRYFTVYFIVVENDPPNTPSKPFGPSEGFVGEELEYRTTAEDPDNDPIRYGYDINNDDVVDKWFFWYVESGTSFTFPITFEAEGTYVLRTIAEDFIGARSNFSLPRTIVITESTNMPPDKPSTPMGPSNGKVGDSLTYSTSSIDPDGDDIRYGWDWNGDDVVDEWSGFKNSGDTHSMSHTWTASGTYNIKVKAEDNNSLQSPFSLVKTVTIISNQEPNKPTITGPDSGRMGSSYIYEATGTDPDGDQIEYWFEWGDGTNSGWIGLYNSGQSASESHSWSAQGTYAVRVKIRDSDYVESVWSDTIQVSMPKGKNLNGLLFKIFELNPIFISIFKEIFFI